MNENVLNNVTCEFSFLNEFLEDDFINMKKCIRYLLDSTFIVEEKEPELFSFITYSSNENHIASVLNLMGFDLFVDRQSRYAMLQQNKDDSDIVGLKIKNLRYFKKHEMVTLLLLWMMYLQKSQYGKAIDIKKSELYEYGRLYGCKFKLNVLNKDLELFRKYNLINFSKKNTELIRLFPTLQFAFNKDELANIVTELQMNLNTDQEELEDVE